MEGESFTSGQKGSFTRLKNQIKGEAESLLAELHQRKIEIDELRAYLLEDDEDGICLKTKFDNSSTEMDSALEKTEELLAQIESVHTKILKSSVGLYPEIESAKDEIDSILEESSEVRKKFNESFIKLYGDGDTESGLEDRLSTLFDKYENDLLSHQTKSNELIKQIEGALSGATNVELAKAFQDQKNSYSWPKNMWTVVFMLSIGVMVYMANDLNSLNSDKTDYALELIKRIPLFGPLIWLALFASKQHGQNKRLQEEYAHKETITKTYVGHKRQIDKLEDSEAKDDLITKLASSTISAIEFNPSSTLEKHTHKDDLPISELLSVLKSSIDKIGK